MYCKAMSNHVKPQRKNEAATVYMYMQLESQERKAGFGYWKMYCMDPIMMCLSCTSS